MRRGGALRRLEARPQHLARGRAGAAGAAEQIASGTAIAHTRWATHGAPVVHNAHPHFSHGVTPTGAGHVALVHNGIIENHDELRAELQAKGYVFESQTDTEVIAHLIDSLYDGDVFVALQARWCSCTARLRWPCSTKTSPTAWWARAPARR